MPLLVHGEVTGARRRCVRSRIAFHRRSARADDRALSEAARGVRAHHHGARGASSCAPRVRASRRRSRRSTCCTTAMRSSKAASARTTTACRSSRREPDREALLAAATSGDPRFFLGTDSAPHAQHTKENACGCAGMFSAHAGIELYAEAFESAGRLERLEGFAARFRRGFLSACRATRDASASRSANGLPPANYPFGDGEARADARRRDVAWHWRLMEDDPPAAAGPQFAGRRRS